MVNPYELILNRLDEIVLRLDKIEKRTQATKLSKSEKLEDEFLDVTETAKFLRLSVATIYSKNSKGELPSMKQGKKVLFSKLDLIEILKKSKKQTLEEINTTDVEFLNSLNKAS